MVCFFQITAVTSATFFLHKRNAMGCVVFLVLEA
jgi:hypothetical protein